MNAGNNWEYILDKLLYILNHYKPIVRDYVGHGGELFIMLHVLYV